MAAQDPASPRTFRGKTIRSLERISPGWAPEFPCVKISLLRRRYSASGGAERFTLRLARMLFQHGHVVSICAESWPEARDGTYHVVPFRSGNVSAYARAARQYAAASDSL